MRDSFKPLLTIAALAIFIAFASMEARADPVTFSSAATFTCAGCSGSGTNTVTFMGGMGNALMLTFTGVSATVDTSPLGFTFTSFGEIQTSTSGIGATITPGTTLTLTITQTAPTPGSGPLAAILSGTVTQNFSNGQMIFIGTHLQIGDVGYDIVNNPFPLVPPSSNNGVTTVQGRVTLTAVPEPASMVLLGTGLLGIAGAVRRRFKHGN